MKCSLVFRALCNLNFKFATFMPGVTWLNVHALCLVQTHCTTHSTRAAAAAAGKVMGECRRELARTRARVENSVVETFGLCFKNDMREAVKSCYSTPWIRRVVGQSGSVRKTEMGCAAVHKVFQLTFHFFCCFFFAFSCEHVVATSPTSLHSYIKDDRTSPQMRLACVGVFLVSVPVPVCTPSDFSAYFFGCTPCLLTSHFRGAAQLCAQNHFNRNVSREVLTAISQRATPEPHTEPGQTAPTLKL